MKNFDISISLAHIPLTPPWDYGTWESAHKEEKTVFKQYDLQFLFVHIWWKKKIRPMTEEELVSKKDWISDPLESVDLTDFEGGPWKCKVTVHENKPMQFELTGPSNIQYLVANRSHAEVIMSALNALDKAEKINATK